MTGDRLTRRRLLALAAGGAGASAGCSGLFSNGSGEQGTTTDASDGGSATGTGRGASTGAPAERGTPTDWSTPTPTASPTPTPTPIPATGEAAYATFRADAGNTGHASGAVGPREGPTVAWRTALYGQPHAPTVVGDRVYVALQRWHRGRPNLLCLAAADGEEVWAYDLGGTANGPPTVATVDGTRTVYALESDGRVHAVAAAGGEARWTASVPEGPFGTTPVLAGETLVVTGDTTLHGLNPADGSERWSTTLPGGPAAMPAVDGSTVYLPLYPDDDERHLVALDARSGGVRWQHESENAFNFSPTAREGRVYVPGDDGVVVRDGQSGERRSSVEVVRLESPVAVTGATVVYRAGQSLASVDPGDGRTRWRRELSYAGEPPAPTVGRRTVYAVDDNDGIAAVDYATGRVLFKHGFERGEVVYSPTVAGESLLVATGGSEEGNAVVAFE